MRNRWLCVELALITAGMALWTAGCQSSGGSGAASEAPAATKAAADSPVSKENPCTLLTMQQVKEAVQLEPVIREIVDEVTCSYEFFPPASSEKPTATAKQKSEEEKAEATAKDFTVGATGGAPKFSYTIHWADGKTAVMAARMAGKLLASEMENAFTKIEGAGDEAWLGPLASTAIILKGDVAVELDLRLLPEGKERGTRLVKAIASRL
jgi:hypothetical protein